MFDTEPKAVLLGTLRRTSSLSFSRVSDRHVNDGIGKREDAVFEISFGMLV